MQERDEDRDGATVDRPPVLPRRHLLRQLARDAVTTAASVAGALQATSQAASGAVGEILAPEPERTGSPSQGGARLPVDRRLPAGVCPAWRVDGDSLLVLDQRRLPGTAEEITIRRAPEAARAIRERMIAGPASVQLAVMAMAESVAALAAARVASRGPVLRGFAAGLRDASADARELRIAVERLVTALERAQLDLQAPDAVPDGLASLGRAEAAVICGEIDRANERLVAHGLDLLIGDVFGDSSGGDGPLRVLLHGSSGSLWGGRVGTALEIVRRAANAGRTVEATVLEGAPSHDGARLAAWELARSAIAHAVVHDTAAGLVLEQRQVDVVLVGAHRVALDGSVASTCGTLPLAVLAGRAKVPFIVCVPLSAVDPDAPDATALNVTDSASRAHRPPASVPRGTPFRSWDTDVTPAELVTALVSDEGVLRHPFADELASLLAGRSADEVRGAVGSPEPTAFAVS